MSDPKPGVYVKGGPNGTITRVAASPAAAVAAVFDGFKLQDTSAVAEPASNVLEAKVEQPAPGVAPEPQVAETPDPAPESPTDTVIPATPAPAPSPFSN